MLKNKKRLLVGMAMSAVLTLTNIAGVFANDSDTFKRGIMKLERIECTSVGEDPGSCIEVYGKLSFNGRTLWELGEDDAVDISEGGPCNLGIQKSFTVDKGCSIKIDGHLFEEDPWYNGDDDMGAQSRTISYDEVATNGTFTLEFQEAGQQAKAVFKIIECQEYID